MYDELAESLVKFGITHNQAKVYLATLRLGETAIEPISKLSGVRREDVYRALPRLYHLGIMKHMLGSPLRVKAVSLEEAIDTLMQEKKESMESELNDLDGMSKALIQDYANGSWPLVDYRSTSQFEVIEGKVAIKRRNLEMVRSFRLSMAAILSDDQLVSLIEEGVFGPRNVDSTPHIRLIISSTTTARDSAIREWQDRMNGAARIKYVRNISTQYSIFDGELAFFYLPCEDNGRISLLSNHPQFISFLMNNFNWLWDGTIMSGRFKVASDLRQETV